MAIKKKFDERKVQVNMTFTKETVELLDALCEREEPRLSRGEVVAKALAAYAGILEAGNV